MTTTTSRKRCSSAASSSGLRALNSGQILALGGAAAAGVPEELPPVPSFVDLWTPSGKYAKADTALSVVINPGDTTISNASISLTLNGEAVATDIASADGVLSR